MSINIGRQIRLTALDLPVIGAAEQKLMTTAKTTRINTKIEFLLIDAISNFSLKITSVYFSQLK